MVKQNSSTKKKVMSTVKITGLVVSMAIILFVLFSASTIYFFTSTQKDKIYPGVRVDELQVGGKTREEVLNYYERKSLPLKTLNLKLVFEDKVATISGEELQAGYDAKLAATQAYTIGRSGNVFSDIYQIWRARTSGVNLTSIFTTNESVIDETVAYLSQNIDIAPQDALFQFEQGKVIAFAPSKDGRRLNSPNTKSLVMQKIAAAARDENLIASPMILDLPVETVLPSFTTENSNTYGIAELIGVGKSKFAGSIENRKKNIQRAASRISGRLIPPGEVFSFNNTLGDVSVATGFLPAYIIQQGRTVLGDGGGVCQVSTTLFRAVLNAGLPIEERRAHAYRVSYYEQDSGPGLDATVFAPSVDFKFKNDTAHYILIQAITDISSTSLTFELYGTSDGRRAEVTKPVILSQSPPPEDFYQDDPTLEAGVVKQVDWRAWGAKVNFNYKVMRGEEIIYDKVFFSAFQPWRAVFLRGTKV